MENHLYACACVYFQKPNQRLPLQQDKIVDFERAIEMVDVVLVVCKPFKLLIVGARYTKSTMYAAIYIEL